MFYVHVFSCNSLNAHSSWSRLASVGILRKERESGVEKLDCHGNFDTGFERNYFVQNPIRGFYDIF